MTDNLCALLRYECQFGNVSVGVAQPPYELRFVLATERLADNFVYRREVALGLGTDDHARSITGKLAAVHETPEDLEALQRLLDESYATAGPHLLSIHTPNWRISAEEVAARLKGMVLLTLATVNSKGQPILGPVDGMFFRGRFFCGSATNSMRARHIRARPDVSAAHVPGEHLAVIVHGTAKEVDKSSELGKAFRSYIVEVYGQEMTEWEGSDVAYWEIEPRKMFALAPQVGASVG